MMSNYKDWIDAIDIKVDYFAAFMKAWIAFNSWYESEIEGRNDKDKIEFISNKTNRFKTYINNLLSDETPEAVSFRENIAMLHASLISAAITTQEYIGVKQPISFSEVAVKNLNNQFKTEYYYYRYQCTRVSGKIITIIANKTSGIEIFHFEQTEHNPDEIKQQTAFLELSKVQQSKCIESYMELRPYVIETILDASQAARKFGVYSFVNDDSKISRAVVIILYSLRCALAHGDISPDAQANKVYRYAYEVLVTPLRKLR